MDTDTDERSSADAATRRHRGRRGAAALVLVALVAAACSNASTAKSSSSSGGSSSASGTGAPPTVAGETDGISASQISVGGLVTETGPLGGVYAGLTQGVKSYFDYINGKGGIYGRKLVMSSIRDDQVVRDAEQGQALVQQDHVFAVFASTPLFPAGTYLGQRGVPTFGTNFNAEWSSGPSMFGHNGSFNDVRDPGPFLSWLIQKVGAQTAGLVAYTVASSADCATGAAAAMKRYGVNVGLIDNSLPFGASDITADIQKMKDAKVDFVGTCMDPTGNVLVANGLRKAGLTSVKMYWPNGYDAKTLASYPTQMEGVYFGLQEVPLQSADKVPAMQLFSSEMAKLYPGVPLGEEALDGWIVADLFATGLQKAGKNPTRSSLVAQLNTITNWTAGGIIPAVDWTKQHTGVGNMSCTAVVQVQHGRFVPVFDTPKSPFVCFPPHATTTATIPGQPYTDAG